MLYFGLCSAGFVHPEPVLLYSSASAVVTDRSPEECGWLGGWVVAGWVVAGWWMGGRVRTGEDGEMYVPPGPCLKATSCSAPSKPSLSTQS